MSAKIGDLEQYVLKILQPERRETNGTGFFAILMDIFLHVTMLLNPI